MDGDGFIRRARQGQQKLVVGHVEVLLGEALFKFLSRGFDEWGGQGFGELYLIFAPGTDDCRFGHKILRHCEANGITAQYRAGLKRMLETAEAVLKGPGRGPPR